MSEASTAQHVLRFHDIHAHLADPRLLPNVESIIRLSRAEGVAGILATAARVAEWPAIAALSQQEGVYGALGLHPFFIDEWSADLPNILKEYVRLNPGVCAIGEIGLDFYHGRSQAEFQYQVFSAQLMCAAELSLPVAVHNRKSWPDFFGILKDIGSRKPKGFCHHFSGSIDIARQILSKGFYLSFCGPLTRPGARRLREAARFVPLDRILTETDAPDLAPEPFRGSQSRPWHVRYVVRAIAEIKGIRPWQVAEAVEANFRSLLGT